MGVGRAKKEAATGPGHRLAAQPLPEGPDDAQGAEGGGGRKNRPTSTSAPLISRKGGEVHPPGPGNGQGKVGGLDLNEKPDVFPKGQAKTGRQQGQEQDGRETRVTPADQMTNPLRKPGPPLCLTLSQTRTPRLPAAQYSPWLRPMTAARPT